MYLKYAVRWHIHVYQFIPCYASAIHKHTRILKQFEDSELTGLKGDIAVSNLMLYAQSTSPVISGRIKRREEKIKQVLILCPSKAFMHWTSCPAWKPRPTDRASGWLGWWEWSAAAHPDVPCSRRWAESSPAASRWSARWAVGTPATSDHCWATSAGWHTRWHPTPSSWTCTWNTWIFSILMLLALFFFSFIFSFFRGVGWGWG